MLCADFDLRNVIHFSGGYELPFGKGKRYMNQGGIQCHPRGLGHELDRNSARRPTDQLRLPTSTTSGAGQCNDVLFPGQSPKLGVKIATQGGYHGPFWIGNPGGIQPALSVGGSVRGDHSDRLIGYTNCVPSERCRRTGQQGWTDSGPGFHRFDFSLFKNFQINERVSVQFRSEFFNILNHPNFNAPNFGGNGVNSIGGSGDYTSSTFGAIGSTRDAPFDPRQIQFA